VPCLDGSFPFLCCIYYPYFSSSKYATMRLLIVHQQALLLFNEALFVTVNYHFFLSHDAHATRN
ncbi:MAG: hypothetical protein ACI8RD_007927, partial [Bacillariaceae sp.]